MAMILGLLYVAVVGIALIAPLWVVGYRTTRRRTLARRRPSSLLQWVQGLLALGIVTAYIPIQRSGLGWRALRDLLRIYVALVTITSVLLLPGSRLSMLIAGLLALVLFQRVFYREGWLYRLSQQG